MRAETPKERKQRHRAAAKRWRERLEQHVREGKLIRWPSIKALMAAARRGSKPPSVKGQAEKMQTRYDYSQGPMIFLGQQIVKEMQKAGYPSKIAYGYRSPDHQARLYAQGRTAPGPVVTRAKAWRSPHNYYEAVDICHEKLGWKVSEEYWTTLEACVRIVESKYGVKLTHGHDWDGDGIPVHLDDDERFRDSAHIQMADWRAQKRHWADVIRLMTLTGREREKHLWRIESLRDDILWRRFQEVLPEIAKTLINDPRGARVPRGVSPDAIDPSLISKRRKKA